MKDPALSIVVSGTDRDTVAEAGYVRSASTSVSPLVMGWVVPTEPFRRCVRQKDPLKHMINHTIMKKEVVSCCLQN